MKEDTDITKFIHSLLRLTDAELPNICAQIILAYCENSYFSSMWWNSLDPQVRDHLAGLAANPNPGYSELVFLKDSVVPWKLKEVVKV